MSVNVIRTDLINSSGKIAYLLTIYVTIQVRRTGQENTRQSHLISASASHLYLYSY